MKNVVMITFICCLAGACLGRAQKATPTPPPLPPGPLIRMAPVSSKWLMSLKDGAVSEQDMANPATKWDSRAIVIKSGSIRYEVAADAGGGRQDKWFQGPYEATILPKQAPLIYAKGATVGGGDFADFSKSDFDGFEWIRRKNYVGLYTLMGIQCIVFHDGPVTLNSNGYLQSIPQSGTTAFIMIDDRRLPVLLKTDQGVTLYTFEDPPQTPLTLPPDVATQFDRLTTQVNKAAAPPAIP